jgi:hypothetical protein
LIGNIVHADQTIKRINIINIMNNIYEYAHLWAIRAAQGRGIEGHGLVLEVCGWGDGILAGGGAAD